MWPSFSDAAAETLTPVKIRKATSALLRRSMSVASGIDRKACSACVIDGKGVSRWAWAIASSLAERLKYSQSARLIRDLKPGFWESHLKNAFMARTLALIVALDSGRPVAVFALASVCLNVFA